MRTIYIGKLRQHASAPSNEGNVAISLILEMDEDMASFYETLYDGEAIIITQTSNEFEVEHARQMAEIRKKLLKEE